MVREANGTRDNDRAPDVEREKRGPRGDVSKLGIT